MPPSSTTSVRSPSDAPYTAAESPAGPDADDDDVERVRVEIRHAPAASAISVSDGSHSTVPSGNTISGRRACGPAPAISSRPLSELASQNACGAAALLEHRPQLVRPSRPVVADDVDGLRDALPFP